MINLNLLFPFAKDADGTLNITESFFVECERESGAGCTVIGALSFYIGDSAPKIKFELGVCGDDNPLYVSHSYRIGKRNEYTRQSWRIPPLFLPKMTLRVHVEIPSGTVLCIKDFGASENLPFIGWSGGLRHNAHLGFWGLAPDNTMPAFELAAASGFSACIVVPKVTSDGVLVCIHDDTINRTARDKDGNAPAEPVCVWDKTYEELSEWEYGSYKNKIYKGTRLPLLSEFFDLCAKTGMSPMFSTHPALTAEQWKTVKEMLLKRGLLKKFHVKSFDIEVLKTAYSIFGADIDGYTYDIGQWNDCCIKRLIDIGVDVQLCRCGIEVRFDEYTERIANDIRGAGFFASAWDIKRRDFSEYEKLISWGVTEFTEDYHCSMGMNY